MSELIRDGFGMQGEVNWLVFLGLIIGALILNWISKGGSDE